MGIDRSKEVLDRIDAKTAELLERLVSATPMEICGLCLDIIALQRAKALILERVEDDWTK